MEIKIFDVVHGFCAGMMTDEGHVWLFDCGNNPASGFQPRDFLIDSGCNVVNRFFVLNFNEVGRLTNRAKFGDVLAKSVGFEELKARVPTDR